MHETAVSAGPQRAGRRWSGCPGGRRDSRLPGFRLLPWAAVAMTLLTLTTVGSASTSLPISVLVFTAGLAAGLALLGVSVFVVIVGLAASAIVEGRVGVLSRSRRMRQRISDPDGHYIVRPYGRVGRAIARELEAEGIPFVVVGQQTRSGTGPGTRRCVLNDR